MIEVQAPRQRSGGRRAGSVSGVSVSNKGTQRRGGGGTKSIKTRFDDKLGMGSNRRKKQPRNRNKTRKGKPHTEKRGGKPIPCTRIASLTKKKS